MNSDSDIEQETLQDNLLYFDDMRVGDCWLSPSREITADDVADFAHLSGDHDPLHQDVNGSSIVGTYRLIRGDKIGRMEEFYSSSEYDLSPIMKFPGSVLELGRSCVAPAYRCRSVMQLLWRGVAEYVTRNDICLMFGCGSLPGADLDRHAETLSYLHANHLAPEELRVRAQPDRYEPMTLRDPAALNLKTALAGLPPLIKGYLRLGGMVGDGAVLDREFNTTDICIIVETSRITDKYARKFIQAPSSLSAAEVSTRRRAAPWAGGLRSLA